MLIGLTHMAYILAALLFIMALAGLSKQETAKIKSTEKALPVAENVKAEGQTQRPSNPFCVPDDFQTGIILGGKGNGK